METMSLRAATDCERPQEGRKPPRRATTPAVKSLLRLRRLLENSGVTGLSRASKSSTQSTRLFWVFLLCGGVVGFTVNLYHVTQRYLSNPVLNVYTPEFEPFIWPDIIVCNAMNPIPFWRSRNLSTRWQELVRRANTFQNVTYSRKAFFQFDHTFLMSSINPRAFHLDDGLAMLPLFQIRYLAETISSSTGSYDAFVFMRPVGAGFHFRLDSEFFPVPCLCISPSNHPQLLPLQGARRTLRSVKMAIAMSYESYKRFDCHYTARGLHIHITSPNQTMSFSRAHKIDPGSVVKVHMTMSRTKRLREKTNCIDRPFEIELYDALLETSRKYKGTYEDCKNFVSQRIFLRECRCYNPFLPIYRSAQHPPRLCLNFSHYSDADIFANVACLDRVLQNYTDNPAFTDLVHSECVRYRSPLCDELSYSADMDTRRLTTEANSKRAMYNRLVATYVPGAPVNAGVTYIRSNLAVVEVEASAETGDLLSQDFEYPTAQYISDLGGIIGLWVGLSIIGLFELVEILYAAAEYIVAMLVTRKLARKNQNHR